jgi:hypothetical protein
MKTLNQFPVTQFPATQFLAAQFPEVLLKAAEASIEVDD